MERERPGWMIPSQKDVSGTVVSIDDKKGTVAIEGLTPSRAPWAKVVPIEQVSQRGV